MVSITQTPTATTLAPPLTDSYSWFDYYDRDRSGTLDQEEVIFGLLNALHQKQQQDSTTAPSVDVIRESVKAIWPAFDINGDGHIDREEFCSPGRHGRIVIGRNHCWYSSGQAQSTDRGFFSSRPSGGYPVQDLIRHIRHMYRLPHLCHLVAVCLEYTILMLISNNRVQGRPLLHLNRQWLKQFMPVTYKTLRVQIPPGMGPGQKLKVLTDNTGNESVIVTIPDRSQWRSMPGLDSHFSIYVYPKSQSL